MTRISHYRANATSFNLSTMLRNIGAGSLGGRGQTLHLALACKLLRNDPATSAQPSFVRYEYYEICRFEGRTWIGRIDRKSALKINCSSTSLTPDWNANVSLGQSDSMVRQDNRGKNSLYLNPVHPCFLYAG